MVTNRMVVEAEALAMATVIILTCRIQTQRTSNGEGCRVEVEGKVAM